MKKFVKGLLVSGFAVALLAGCSNKGKSSECPQPEPAPVKDAWTSAEKELFKVIDLNELPFDFELSVDELTDEGVLYATSANEVSDEDVEAYADKLLENDVYTEYDAGTADGLTLDASALGFADDAELFQFSRPYKDDADYFATDVVTIGLDADNHLRVAAVEAYLPLYNYGAGITNGTRIYTLEFTSTEYGVIDFYNMYYGNVVASVTGGTYSQTVPTNRAAHPEVFTDETCGAFLNYGVTAPYFWGNPYSEEFKADYVVSFIKDLPDSGDPVSYSLSEFDAVLDRALALMEAETAPYEPVFDYDYGYVDDSDTPDYTKGVWFTYLDLAGFEITVTYSFEEASLSGKATNIINVEFEPVEFEAPIRARELTSVLGESISYDAQFQVGSGYYMSMLMVGESTEKYDADAAGLDIDIALYQTELVDLYQLQAWTWKDNAMGPGVGAYVESLTFYDNYYVQEDLYLFEQEISGKTYWVLGIMGQELTANQLATGYAQYLNMGVSQGVAYGLISNAQASSYYNSFTYVMNICSAASEVNQLFEASKEVLYELFGVEEVVDNYFRLDEADLADYEGLYDAVTEKYEAVYEDLFNDYYFFRYLAYDLAYLDYYVEMAAGYVRTACEADFADILVLYEIVEDNYDVEEWTEIEDAVSAFNLNDCYNSDECYDKMEEFCEDILEDVETWEEKYSRLLAAYKAAYPASREAEFDPADWLAICNALEAFETALANATSAAEARAAYEDAEYVIDSTYTILEKYKQSKLDELETSYSMYSSADYMSEDWELLEQAKLDGVTAILGAADEEGVDAALTNAQGAMAAVVTKATRISDAKDAFDTWYAANVDESKYSDANREVLHGIIQDCKDAYDAATSNADIETAFAAAQAAIADVPEETI